MKRTRPSLLVFALVAPLSLLAASGCPGHQAQQLRTAVIPLGSPVGGCTGVENDVRGDRTSKVTKTLLDSGCRHRISWRGTLLDVSSLLDKLAAGQTPAITSVELRFEPLTLTDEVGQPIAVKLPALSFSFEAGGETLLETSGKDIQNPLTAAKKVTFSAKLRAALAAHLAKHTPFEAHAEIDVELSEAARKALAAKTKGPLLELRFTAVVVAKAAGEASAVKAPASQPAKPAKRAPAAPAAQPASAPASKPAS